MSAIFVFGAMRDTSQRHQCRRNGYWRNAIINPAINGANAQDRATNFSNLVQNPKGRDFLGAAERT